MISEKDLEENNSRNEVLKSNSGAGDGGSKELNTV